jgi:phage/plasmid-associated DNA primase
MPVITKNLLTLPDKDLTKYTFKENINMKLLRALIKAYEQKKIGTITRDDFFRLKSLYDNRKISKSIYYEYKNNFSYERIYPKDFHNSIQGLNVEIRNSLTFHLCSDVDIQSCFNSIAYNLAKYFNLHTPRVNEYYHNKDKFIKALENQGLTTTEAKEKMRLMFQDNNFQNYCKYTELVEYNKEIYNTILPTLKEQFPDFVDNVKTIYQTKNKEFTEKALNYYFYATIENKIINIAFQFFKINKIQVSTIIHDGMLIVCKDNEKINSLLIELNKFIKDNYFGFDIKFCIKEMTLLDNIEELTAEKDNLNDRAVYDEFKKINHANPKFVIKNKILYNCNEYNIWEEDEEGISLLNFLNSEYFNNILKCEYNNTFIESYKSNQSICSILSYIRRQLVNQKIEFDNDPELFAFSNGKAIRLHLDKPYEIVNVKPSDYITMTTGYPLDLTIDKNYLNEIKQIIEAPFLHDDIKDFNFTILAKSMYGEVLTKNFYMNYGSVGNNGKSTQEKYIKKVFGDYFNSVNSTTFTFESKDPNAPDVQLYNNRKKRIVFTSEIPTGHGVKLNCNKLKNWTGDDTVNARLNFANKEAHFTIQFDIFFNLNEIPYITDKSDAFLKRIVIIPWDVCFTENPILPHEKQTLHKSFFNKLDNKFANHYLYILLQYWNKFVENKCKLIIPDNIKLTTQMKMGEFNPLLNFIDTFIIKTNDTIDNFIKVSELYDIYRNHLEENKKPLLEKNFRTILSNLGFICKKIDKTIDGKRHNYNAFLYCKINQEALENVPPNDEYLF